MHDLSEFAVVDVETTGLSPVVHDRIIEIALIRTDLTGRILDEYVTLVNPQRDLGPTYIHGITADQIRQAPVFDEIVGDILSILRGAVFVAHNAPFDKRFVQVEMAQAGYELPDFPFLCTMQLARHADPTIPSRRLHAICDHFGISLDAAHSAYCDARATAGVLATCAKRLGVARTSSPASLGVQGPPPSSVEWPSCPPSGRSLTRTAAARCVESTPSFIATLIARLPVERGQSPERDDYLSLLDRVLEDRRITSEEVESMYELARELGLTRRAAEQAHRIYMRDLMRVAWEDGVLTDTERKDLETVRHLLDICSSEYREMLYRAEKERFVNDRDPSDLNYRKRIVDGKTICFTGTMTSRIKGRPIDRAFAEKVAREHGMLVRPRVTKGLDYLVVADPDSMSHKANTARKYGVRLLAEPVFWQMVGIDVE